MQINQYDCITIAYFLPTYDILYCNDRQDILLDGHVLNPVRKIHSVTTYMNIYKISCSVLWQRVSCDLIFLSAAILTTVNNAGAIAVCPWANTYLFLPLSLSSIEQHVIETENRDRLYSFGDFHFLKDNQLCHIDVEALFCITALVNFRILDITETIGCLSLVF